MTRTVSILEILSITSALSTQLLGTAPMPVILGRALPARKLVVNFNGSQAEFEKSLKEGWESLETRIEKYENHKMALILANNLTEVEIGGQKFTVAEAIGIRKVKEDLYSRLVANLANQINQTRTALVNNGRLVKEAEDKASAAQSAGGKSITEASLALMKQSAAELREELIDPLGSEALLKKYQDLKTDWNTRLGILVQVANAQTQVQVDERGFVDLEELRARLQKTVVASAE